MFGFVINVRLAEGHRSSWNSERERLHFKLPFLQDKDSWVMGYLQESRYFRKRDWKESFQNCYNYSAEDGWSLIAIKIDLIARALWKWVIRIEAGLCWKANELLVNKHAKVRGRMVFLQAVPSLLEGTLLYNSDISCLLHGWLETRKAMQTVLRAQHELGGVLPEVEITFSR